MKLPEQFANRMIRRGATSEEVEAVLATVGPATMLGRVRVEFELRPTG
jgi:hypothetical protein